MIILLCRLRQTKTTSLQINITVVNRQQKKQGAQTGHSGHHLSKADIEKKIAKKKIQCQEVVLGNPSDSFTTRYKIDIDIGVNATKYIIYADKNGKFQIPKELTADVSYGPTVNALSADLYSEGVVAIDRISDLINSMSNGVPNIASGTIYGFCSKFAKKKTSVLLRTF